MNYRHIFIDNPTQTVGFTRPGGGSGKFRTRSRNRVDHSTFLQTQLDAAWKEVEDRQTAIHVARQGAYFDFRGDPGCDLMLKSLENRSQDIRLLNVRRKVEDEGEVIYATVYIPHSKRGYFLRRITQYASEETATGKPKNQKLVESIADIRKSVLESFWQDDFGLLPNEDPAWIEVWLSSDDDETISVFDSSLQEQNIEQAEGLLKFPERTIKLIRANRTQLEGIVEFSDHVAELRSGKEVATVYITMENALQTDAVRNILSRTEFDEHTDVVVCILDTGINNGHALINPVLADSDLHTVDPNWGTHDHHGHGTWMAGVVTYGDLLEILQSGESLQISHILESAKILPPPPDRNERELWGHMTAQGISRAEIQAPGRKRITCLVTTSTDSRDRGRPSSWSATLDSVTSGSDDGSKQLVVVSAGNIQDPNEWKRYPDSNQTNEIHDPGQAWNALTVGAHTEKVTITDPTLQGYSPIAPLGGLSPFSTTSLNWQKRWPVKPEILLEGGNVAEGPNQSIYPAEDLSLLSTSSDPQRNQFEPFYATSAATAQGAWMAARIQKEYPDAWPETVRALMVHSASWTDTMKGQFLSDESKTAYGNLLRICGYGVPDLNKALYCAANTLTLISQAEIWPFERGRSGRPKTREMHLYALPWPLEALEELQEIVEMRVTLSYFIEPGPGEVGWQDRYRYSSHGLRFSVKGPAESRDEFEQRINAQTREGRDRPDTSGPTDKWVIGSQNRDVGSIHSDIWRGPAVELATSNLISVWPIGGWWRDRAHLGGWEKSCRYSLVVSIHTPPESVDIYIPVATQLGITTPIEIRVS